jgi:hypothetical protein
MLGPLDGACVVLAWEAEETCNDSLFEVVLIGEFNSFYYSRALIGE